MKTIKYELYGFSCLVGLAVILLAQPGKEEDRRALKDSSRTAISQSVFGTR